jgi:hypothetical protein
MLVLFGLGAGAAMLGYSFVSDARPEAERMPEVLGKAIEKSILKVGANGEVTVAEGAEVSLKPGGKVGIDPHSWLRIDPNSSIRAVSEPQSSRVGLTEPATSARGAGRFRKPCDNKLRVLRTSKYGPGEVLTGWKYSDGEAQIPEDQYCYFTLNVDGAQRDLRIDIGKDGRQLAPIRRVPNVNFNDAYRLCTWFNATQ